MTVLICLTAVQAVIVTATCLALLLEVHRSRRENREGREGRLMLEAEIEREVREILHNGAETSRGSARA